MNVRKTVGGLFVFAIVANIAILGAIGWAGFTLISWIITK